MRIPFNMCLHLASGFCERLSSSGVMFHFVKQTEQKSRIFRKSVGKSWRVRPSVCVSVCLSRANHYKRTQPIFKNFFLIDNQNQKFDFFSHFRFFFSIDRYYISIFWFFRLSCSAGHVSPPITHRRLDLFWQTFFLFNTPCHPIDAHLFCFSKIDIDWSIFFAFLRVTCHPP